MHAALVAVGGDGCSRIVGRHQGREGGSADALSPRFIGELPLPPLEAGRRAAALRGVSLAGHQRESHQACDGDRPELSAVGHLRTPFTLSASGETPAHPCRDEASAGSRTSRPELFVSPKALTPSPASVTPPPSSQSRAPPACDRARRC